MFAITSGDDCSEGEEERQGAYNETENHALHSTEGNQETRGRRRIVMDLHTDDWRSDELDEVKDEVRRLHLGLRRKCGIVKQLVHAMRLYATANDDLSMDEPDTSLLSEGDRSLVKELGRRRRQCVQKHTINYRDLKGDYEEVKRECAKLRGEVAEGRSVEKEEDKGDKGDDGTAGEMQRLSLRCSKLTTELAASKQEVAEVKLVDDAEHKRQLDEARTEIPLDFASKVKSTIERLTEERDELIATLKKCGHPQFVGGKKRRVSDGGMAGSVGGSPCNDAASKRRSASPCIVEPKRGRLADAQTGATEGNIVGRSAVRVEKYGTSYRDWPRQELEKELSYAMCMWGKNSAELNRLKKVADVKERSWAKTVDNYEGKMVEHIVKFICERASIHKQLSEGEAKWEIMKDTMEAAGSDKCKCSTRQRSIDFLKVRLSSVTSAHDLSSADVKKKNNTIRSLRENNALLVHGIAKVKMDLVSLENETRAEVHRITRCIDRCSIKTSTQMKELLARVKLHLHGKTEGKANKENVDVREMSTELSPPTPSVNVDVHNVKPCAIATAPSIVSRRRHLSQSSCSTEDAKTAVQLNAVRRSFKDGLTRISGHLMLEPYTVGEGGQYALREHKEHVMAGVKQLAVKLEVGGWTTFTK